MPQWLRKFAQLGMREYTVSLRQLEVLAGVAGALEAAALILLALLVPGWLFWSLLVVGIAVAYWLMSRRLTDKSLSLMLRLEQWLGTGPKAQVIVTPAIVAIAPAGIALAAVAVMMVVVIVMMACVLCFMVICVVLFGLVVVVAWLLYVIVLVLYWAVIPLVIIALIQLARKL